MGHATTITMNVKISEYTSRVLGVIKEKYGLRDKGQALDRFAEMYGDEYVDKEVREEYVKKILAIHQTHVKKHPNRKMSDKELDELTGM